MSVVLIPAVCRRRRKRSGWKRVERKKRFGKEEGK